MSLLLANERITTPWVVRMVAGVVLGSGRVPGEGWPLFGVLSRSVLADVESGAWVGVGP